ncbi:peroxiredoxin Q/BCP [Arcanobacterium wilhelmae]|uniref:thioredoxin-dependent peroxiredoxin n=1 Tax=Arcanobacterium wilhelmae TaxID=1803177 RepID=A0ABT9NCZ6_9ACTO|nr:thioredoxin-dependent thiol peroxidase [Arcanobacterium wilhelmae]MDP9801597.1 peroxiredoxin Q/BCP [Arcanobacterium wilhelmae]WFN90920.1 thioredoxin-dependent thiol peroxidase [Arcanobacterium wilhelmae]
MTFEVGLKAPDFTLPVAGGGEVTLSHVLAGAEKGVIVYFYPRAMTPGCTKEACDFRDSENSLKSAGYSVIGISPDSVERLEKFTAKEALNFPLASDEDMAVATEWGVYGEKKNYGKVSMGIIRSTFVIDPDGTFSQVMYNVKATGHVARVRKALGIDE